MSTALLELTQRDAGHAPCSASVTLTFEQRQRSRLRVTLDDGREAAILLPRGQLLRGGDRLRAATGECVLVESAAESLSQVNAPDPCALARAAYHLGNRHVAVQVGPGWLRYAHDHVLDDMVRGLDLKVSAISDAFEPEAGAYAGAHPHAHGDGHSHE